MAQRNKPAKSNSSSCEIATYASRRSPVLLIASLLLLLTFAGSPSSHLAYAAKEATPASPVVPEQFHALYKDLQKTLIEDRRHYSPNTKGELPHVAPALFMASSFYGATDEGTDRWHDLIATIDAFKDLGADAVSVMISLPDLSDDDAPQLVDFYSRLATEIHKRKMKLYIEHFISPPSRTKKIQDFSNDEEGRQAFFKMLQREIAFIYKGIKPDYLTIVSEPQTINRWTQLTLSPEEISSWLDTLCTALKRTGVSPNTLLGAGAGTWENDEYLVKFAGCKDLDYIDFHFYPLMMNGKNSLATMSLQIEELREVRPDMMVNIGETWLYKHGSQDPGGMYDKEAYKSNNYSFWAPLDQTFLKLLMAVAKKEKISVVAPYFSQYLFTSYDFGSDDANKLPAFPGCMMVSWVRAVKSIQLKQLTPIGTTLKELLNGQ